MAKAKAVPLPVTVVVLVHETVPVPATAAVRAKAIIRPYSTQAAEASPKLSFCKDANCSCVRLSSILTPWASTWNDTDVIEASIATTQGKTLLI